MDRFYQKAGMAHGDYLDRATLDAVKYPVASMDDFANLPIVELGHLTANLREVGKMLDGGFHIQQPLVGSLRIVVFGDRFCVFRKPTLPARRPRDFHVAYSLRRSSKTCLCGMPLPASSSAMPAAMSPRVSIHSTRSSQSSMLPMKEVGRPFCVMKMRRCVSPTRFRHDARLLRHSEKEMTSSERRGVGNAWCLRRRGCEEAFSFTAVGMSDTPLSTASIVHYYVHDVNGVQKYKTI